MKDECRAPTREEHQDIELLREKKGAIRLLIVDDHAKYRAELRCLLQDEPDIAICGEVDDEIEIVRLADRLKPDVILMDLGNASSIQAVRAICTRHPQTRVILLSLHNDELLVLEGLRAGASAHISKFSRPAEFAPIVRGVHSGLVSVDSPIMGRILEELRFS